MTMSTNDDALTQQEFAVLHDGRVTPVGLRSNYV